MGRIATFIVLGLCCAYGLNAQNYTSVSAFTPSTYFLGIAAGDFNGDGLNDVAVSNADNETIDIYLNVGDGTLGTSPTHSYNLGAGVGKLVAGYFDSDTEIDIAAQLYDENTVQALLSNGDGTFAVGTRAAATTEESATYFSVFQESAGGMHTIFIGNKFAGTVTLYRPDGNGGFAAPEIIQTVHNAGRIGAGDIDNDGDIDFTVGNGSGSTLMIHRNNGSGDYSDTQEMVVDKSAGHECFIADLNDDDVNDIVVVLHNYDVNSLRVFHGMLGGGFDEVQVLDGGSYPIEAELHDVDGKDGLDMVLTDNDGVYIFLNDGNGMLSKSDSIIFQGFTPRDIAVCKLNSDRFWDIALVSMHGGRVYLSGAGSSVESTQPFPVGVSMAQNYPNPVVSETTIPFKLARTGYVTISLYTLTGELVRVLSSGIQSAGAHTVRTDLRGLTPGLYLYRINAGSAVRQRMLVVLPH